METKQMMRKSSPAGLLIGLFAVALIWGGTGCGQQTESGDAPVRLAFVTNNPSDFWAIARAGVKKAEKEFNLKVEFRLPPDGTPADQQRIVEELIVKRISGMAISPNDPENQLEMLNMACEAMNVICHDSDAPNSKRLCYIGTNNYKAGRVAGELIKKVLPEGGELMLYVGHLGAQNAIERRQGIIDELRGEKESVEQPNKSLVCDKWMIVDTRTDNTDRARAKQNVEDTLINHQEVDCLVGLWSYNGPAIISAVKDANKQGKVNIVCFDEEEDTLQGVLDGDIHATVVQQPYEFGYQSMKVLAALARGDKSLIPESGIIEVPVMVINKENVTPFWDNLRKIRAGG